ncbi:MAG: BamA/TamA family outer membrane protein [SAR324 cluster bacterium]|nr:BamA/TamA family outer membrane protein [SAR324 cluster bacterium]
MLNLSSIWKWSFIATLTGCFLVIFTNTGFSTPFPHYQIEVQYKPSQKLLSGKMKVSFAAEYYPSGSLLFSLPMNRFLNPDSRGPRKILQTPVFALDSFKKIEDDPLFPNGFSIGKTRIRSVTDVNGLSLEYKIIDNPDIVVGFSTKSGLLDVHLKSPLPQSTIIIEFETKLPERYQEGLINTELLTVKWHPQLLSFQNNVWKKDLLEPSPGIYDVVWKSPQSGTLITTSGAHHYEANQTIELISPKRPLQYFPLLFSPNYHSIPSAPDSSVQSFYFNTNQDRANLLLQWGEEFLDFFQKQYQLSLPWKQIFIVEILGNHEQIRVVNNIVLVTTPHYQRTSILDRRVLGFFTRGLAELWFGETVWHNMDDQLWLSRGMGTFFGLRFYAHKYGSDAGIFDFIDWINPHYREHFIEEMARNIKNELKRPIIFPIQRSTKHSETRILLRLVTYKAALVISMLEYLVGKDTFQQGLSNFLNNHLYEISTEQDLKKSMELYYGEDLDWFFEQWFHTTKDLDYAIGNISEEELPNGQYKIQIVVEQLASATMPVDVQVSTDNGTVIHKYTRGQEKEETIIFITESPLDKVSLDPNEYLLELERVNNHSFTFFRVRFAFDWKKQREVMSLLIPRVGSNAIDGNQVGIESNNSLGGGYSLLITPGYGTKNKQFLYIVEVEKDKFFYNNISLKVLFSQLGGVISRGFSLDFSSPRRKEGLSHSWGLELEQETVFKTTSDEEDEKEEESEETNDKDSEPEETGDTSNFALAHAGQIGFKNLYFPSWSIRLEQPLIDLGADFSYTILKTSFIHLFNVGFLQRINWTWIYHTTYGTSPLQKKHQLGSPQVLRGYPQRTILRDDQLLASRLDYEFPLIRTPWWGNVTSLGMQGIIFFDIGKVWGNNDHFADSKQRQDAGIGIQWGIDTVALFQFPLKIEIAYPLDDSEFDKPQFVLAGALSFF